MSERRHPRFGCFASEPRLEGELPLCSPIVGQRYDAILIRLTPSEYKDDETQRWIRYLYTRCNYVRDFSINIQILWPHE